MPDLIMNTYFRTRDYLKLHENIRIIIFAAFIGILGGYGAIGFRWLIDVIQSLTVGSGENIIDRLREMPFYVKLLLPAAGGLIVGPLTYFFAREAKGHGVPEVMEAVAIRGGRIRPRVVAVKALASAITLGTGGSVGREGPIVQIGSAMGSSLGSLFKCPPQRLKTLVACGAAAGIAATFNAPITGVLFALEIILGNFAIHTFSPLVVSSVLATVISRHHVGDFPAFTVPKYELRSPGELVLYLILGFLVAWIGLVFMRSIHRFENLFSKFRFPEYLKTSVGLLGMGLIICVFPHCFGNGYETITHTLQNNYAFWLLFLLVPVKSLATSLTLGAGGSGGILAPSLMLGALTGGAFGKLSHGMFPDACASSGAYAMVGMGAMVGAVTHAPFTAIITLFELTGDYHIILPVMFSTIVATMLTSSIDRDSIYTAKLRNRGVRLNQGLESAIMNRNVVREIMHIDAQTIDPEMSFEVVYNTVINSQHIHHYVVGADGLFLGEIAVNDLPRILQQDGIESRRKAKDIMHPNYPFTGPDVSLMECVRTFGLSGVQELPVVDPHTHRFLGVIDYRDIFKLYNREVLREGTLGLKFITKTEETPRSDYVNIPEGYVVELVPVVGKLAGRSIKELDLRGRYNITIVAIKSGTAMDASSEIPKATRILTRKDALIVVGEKSDIASLRSDMIGV